MHGTQIIIRCNILKFSFDPTLGVQRTNPKKVLQNAFHIYCIDYYLSPTTD